MRCGGPDESGHLERKIQGSLYEIRLFNDEPRAILCAQVELLRHGLAYMKLSSVPMLWIVPPVMLVVAQLQSYYGYQHPVPGESFVVEAQLTEAAASALDGRRPDVVLRSSGDGLPVQTPAVWMPAQRRLAWRVGLRSPGDYELTLSLDGVTATKSFDARAPVVRRSPLKVRSGFVDQLLHPAESLLPDDGPFQSVGVRLEETGLRIPGPGWEIHWAIAFFVVSLVFVLLLRGRLGVTI